jgi:elongation factor Ts
MAVTAAQVKELREKTGVGMMECKKALQENDGDIEKSILWLRERGLSRAAKKADRVTAEGLVNVAVNDQQNAGVIIELNCETDFVSKNDDFQKFADDIAKLALEHQVNDVETLKTLELNGEKVEKVLTELIAKIGENLNLRRVQSFKVDNGVVTGYIHMGGKIGSLVALEGAAGSAVEELGKDLAMHVAAAAPRYLVSENVDPAEVEQEKELARKKLQEEKKPDHLIEKILTGQINKFYKEICLVEQAFVKDPNVSVKQLVEQQGQGAKLKTFARYQLGEGIDKKKENFADEVASQLKS